MTGKGRIVVGVDGSPSSLDALRWAVQEARNRGAGIEAVYVWHYPAATYAGSLVATPVFARDDLVAEAEAILRESLAKVLAQEEDQPPITQVILEGGAAEGLIRRTGDAELLVVGHGDHGGFAGLLLGSVARQVSAHAGCPVVVVRERKSALKAA